MVCTRGVTCGIRALNYIGGDLEGKVARIKETSGEWNIEEGTMFVWADHAMNELNVQKGLMEKQDHNMEEKLVDFRTPINKGGLQAITAEFARGCVRLEESCYTWIP